MIEKNYMFKIIKNSEKEEFNGLVILSKENVAKVEAMIQMNSRYRSELKDENGYIKFIKNKNDFKAPRSNSGSDLYWINLLVNYLKTGKENTEFKYEEIIKGVVIGIDKIIVHI